MKFRFSDDGLIEDYSPFRSNRMDYDISVEQVKKIVGGEITEVMWNDLTEGYEDWLRETLQDEIYNHIGEFLEDSLRKYKIESEVQ